jgi:hypothetical protein
VQKGISTHGKKGEQRGINREFASTYKAMVNNKFDLESTIEDEKSDLSRYEGWQSRNEFDINLADMSSATGKFGSLVASQLIY